MIEETIRKAIQARKALVQPSSSCSHAGLFAFRTQTGSSSRSPASTSSSHITPQLLILCS